MARKDIYNQEIEIQCYITRQSKRGAWVYVYHAVFFLFGCLVEGKLFKEIYENRLVFV